MARRRTVVDLFAGAGGATQGLKDAGWVVLAAVENDDVAAETYAENHPDVDLRVEDIEGVDPAELRESLDLMEGELSLLKACPPCQGYSILGSGDPEDSRNDLVHQVWRFAKEFVPQVVLMENVPGLANDRRLASLLRSLRGRGYGARTYMVNAVDFGVPQRRRRLILVAARGTPSQEFPDRLEDWLPDRFDRRQSTVRDALKAAGRLGRKDDELHHDRVYPPMVLRRIRSVPIGGSRFDLPEDLALACHDGLGRRATASYGRMSWDEAAPTMTTRCTTPACGPFIHPSEDRAITLREAALLQTFPPRYRFIGGRGAIARQIGNAVPVKMAEGLGRAVERLV